MALSGIATTRFTREGTAEEQVRDNETTLHGVIQFQLSLQQAIFVMTTPRADCLCFSVRKTLYL